MRVSGVRTRVVLWVLIFLACLTSVLPSYNAYAAAITARSLTLEQNVGVTTGASAPSAVGGAGTVGRANHHFKFNIPTTASIRSIGFQYCTTASGTCTAPTDLTAASATLGTTVGLAGSPAITAATSAPYVSFGADPTANAVEITLVAVKNPSDVNKSFYVRITSYTSSNATTGATDTGTVTASTATPIVLTGQMPESLIFCTGATIATAGGPGTIPNCATPTSGAVSFNQLFDTASTSFATSQMAASTNASSGYAITYTAPLLTNGGFTVPSIGATPTAPATGVSQFGMNLRDNATPNVGADITSPTLTNSVYLGTVSANYNTADQYAFVANTATTVATASGPTDAQVYTASYIVNVSGSQAAGTYTSTLTYICTATF